MEDVKDLQRRFHRTQIPVQLVEHDALHAKHFGDGTSATGEHHEVVGRRDRLVLLGAFHGQKQATNADAWQVLGVRLDGYQEAVQDVDGKNEGLRIESELVIDSEQPSGYIVPRLFRGRTIPARCSTSRLTAVPLRWTSGGSRTIVVALPQRLLLLLLFEDENVLQAVEEEMSEVRGTFAAVSDAMVHTHPLPLSLLLV